MFPSPEDHALRAECMKVRQNEQDLFNAKIVGASSFDELAAVLAEHVQMLYVTGQGFRQSIHLDIAYKGLEGWRSVDASLVQSWSWREALDPLLTTLRKSLAKETIFSLHHLGTSEFPRAHFLEINICFSDE